MASDVDEAHENALARATSPYLQQHRHNPVDWVEWSDDAFAEARRRDVPVLVSIGYSTCHWCHVMAHESFEDRATAKLMNDRFVCIKVDREEHPEVDEIYMDAVQALTGHGGWPLNAIADHDGRPFFAGTYFPTNQWQDILRQISEVWLTDRARIDASATQITDHIACFAKAVVSEMPADLWDRLDGSLLKSFDSQNPGFGGAPKFPSSQLLTLLLARAGDNGRAGRMMAEATLQAMQDAGLHDRVGGGFHRYSVDAEWRVPHFEKMLYDNALLMGAYARASVSLGRPDFLRTAIHVGEYLLRDMRVVDDAGVFLGYASAEDADDPGGEGSFYAWSPQAVREVVGGEAAEALIAAWDLRAGTPHIGRSGHYEPVTSHIPQPRAVDLAGLARIGDVQALRITWEAHLPALREARDARARPGRDDKVLTDLNGLALDGLAQLARYSGQSRFEAATRELADVLASRLAPSGLQRMAGKPAFITDYGHLSVGLLSAFDLLGDPALVDRAIAVVDEATERLRAPDGGFFTTPEGRGDLIRRGRESTDNAYPSGLHSLALAFVRLASLTGETRFDVLADGIFAVQGHICGRAPTACATLLKAWHQRQVGHLNVVVTGPADDPATAALLSEARRATHPALTIIPMASGRERDWQPLQGRRDIDAPQAFVCIGDACLVPAQTPRELRERLAQLPA